MKDIYALVRHSLAGLRVLLALTLLLGRRLPARRHRRRRGRRALAGDGSLVTATASTPPIPTTPSARR